MLAPLVTAGLLDEQATHGLGRGGEEMAAVVPLVAALRTDTPPTSRDVARVDR
jgi:hypothetical protein